MPLIGESFIACFQVPFLENYYYEEGADLDM